jgi:hypothetical protein
MKEDKNRDIDNRAADDKGAAGWEGFSTNT